IPKKIAESRGKVAVDPDFISLKMTGSANNFGALLRLRLREIYKAETQENGEEDFFHSLKFR
ncbi:hypothetical protein NL358_27435, partial [Klebsiella pneumoniae]|nr:hypothetical protein [Klebsiella pneumoniae]